MYRSPNIVREIKSRKLGWVGNAARIQEDTGVFRILTCKPKRKRPLGRFKSRLEENVTMDLTEIVVKKRN